MHRNVIAASLLLTATVALGAPVEPPVESQILPKVQTIKVPGGHIPTEIVQHAGALWFVSWYNWPKVEPWFGRISVKGTIRLTEVLNGSMPALTARADDGTLWLSDGKRHAFWHVLTSGQILRVKNDRATVGLAFGPDGTLWATHPGSAAITSYNVDGSVRGRWEVGKQKGVEPRPSWIAAGPDGALWFTDPETDRIGRITIAGVITLFPLPRGWQDPGEIVAAEDALWFAVGNQPRLGRITPKGAVTGVKIHAPARAVAAGPEKQMWYSDGASGIGWIHADGSTDYVLISEKESGVRSIAAGPDGAMWFVDEKARTIGRVELPTP